MRFENEEILETFKMFNIEKLNIRTVTVGISLLDCISNDINKTCKKIEKKIKDVSGDIIDISDYVSKKYSVPITNKRIAVTPISLILSPFPKIKNAVAIAETLDKVGGEIGVDFIGGYGALVEKGMTKSDKILIESIPAAISSTKRVCSVVNVASTNSGINISAINEMAEVLKKTAKLTKNGIGCGRIITFCNAPSDNPFMAGAFHGIQEDESAINLGISGPSAIRSIIEQNQDKTIDELEDIIKRTAFKISRVGELIGREISKEIGIKFGSVDLSLAPTTLPGDSIAEVIEKMGIEKFGAHGTTAAIALLTDAIKKGGVMGCKRVGGLSGTFTSVSEDGGMNKRVKDGILTIEKLEALTAVCSVGIDMIAIPGDVDKSIISGIIADVMAIGVVNNKTTSVRLIPVPGKKPGETVDFGGLLGKGTIMKINKTKSSKFFERGGFIERPITSMKN